MPIFKNLLQNRYTKSKKDRFFSKNRVFLELKVLFFVNLGLETSQQQSKNFDDFLIANEGGKVPTLPNHCKISEFQVEKK